MTRYILARMAVTLLGVGIWGYGQRFDLPNVRMGGIVVIALALLMRFAPKRWFNDGAT